MGQITHREFRTWVAWKKDQWNNPSRSDYYLMQLTGYVKHIMSKKSWNIKSLKIPFQLGSPSKASIDRKTMEAKSTWTQRLGLKE